MLVYHDFFGYPDLDPAKWYGSGSETLTETAKLTIFLTKVWSLMENLNFSTLSLLRDPYAVTCYDLDKSLLYLKAFLLTQGSITKYWYHLHLLNIFWTVHSTLPFSN